jgi:hypothetical protein
MPASQLHHPFDPVRTSTINKTLFLFLGTFECSRSCLVYSTKKKLCLTPQIWYFVRLIQGLPFGCRADSSLSTCFPRRVCGEFTTVPVLYQIFKHFHFASLMTMSCLYRQDPYMSVGVMKYQKWSSEIYTPHIHWVVGCSCFRSSTQVYGYITVTYSRNIHIRNRNGKLTFKPTLFGFVFDTRQILSSKYDPGLFIMNRESES